MNSYMTALDLAYNREKDTRSFLKRRVTALKMAAVLGLAFVLVAVLLMFGPVVESAIARRVGGAGAFVGIAWWVAQWPILLGGLLFAFAAVLYLGPDVKHAKWEFLTPGSLVAALLWIAASGLFAVYTATFASYNKTWGALSAVIVMLTWLWLTAAGTCSTRGRRAGARSPLRSRSSTRTRSRRVSRATPAARTRRTPESSRRSSGRCACCPP